MKTLEIDDSFNCFSVNSSDIRVKCDHRSDLRTGMGTDIPVFTSIEVTLIGFLSGVYPVVLLEVTGAVGRVFASLPRTPEPLNARRWTGITIKELKKINKNSKKQLNANLFEEVSAFGPSSGS